MNITKFYRYSKTILESVVYSFISNLKANYKTNDGVQWVKHLKHFKFTILSSITADIVWNFYPKCISPNLKICKTLINLKNICMSDCPEKKIN